MAHPMSWKRMFGFLLLVLLLIQGAVAAVVTPPPKWLTLSGKPPAVIARGGFSGIFPESSSYSYEFAISTSSRDVVMFCDLQLTKDGAGICKTDLRLDNGTTIAQIFPKRHKTYFVNGEPVLGYFSVDFTSDEIFGNVTLIQNVLSRPDVFDAVMPLTTVDDVIGLKPPQFWLNVQYDIFFKQHKLDIGEYISAALEHILVDYISSPEIGFLKGLNGKLGRSKAKLIFRFLDVNAVEPSTNETYGSLLKDLPKIKSIASGILVPKEYIWPLNADGYLEPATSLVTDAHKLGLEVYASNFANDMPASYNYSYDPTAEYLQFIDNPNFAVDGVLTDFPSTASEAVACLAHNKKNTAPSKGKPLIISHNGASGVFAGCTDIAYQKAVEDGADVIDCYVQMSKDGVIFCLPSADLQKETTAATAFMSRTTTVPEIQENRGIFSFDLTWSEIQSLKPQLNSPFGKADLMRNPAAVNEGKYLTMPEFLDFAKNSNVSGILIHIENAAYLASKKGLGVVDAVSGALTNASYDKQTTQQVFIESDDSAVLSIFKKNPIYKRVLMIRETISDAPKPTIDEIKQLADAVSIPRSSIFTYSGSFVTHFTDVVNKMHAGNISVYVMDPWNEYIAIAFDFFSDPMVELATCIVGVGVDGVVTDFPATASSYLRSPCSDPNAKLPYTILPAEPGSLVAVAPPDVQPPAQAPAPLLSVADVVDPPLSPVVNLVDQAPDAAPTTSPPSPSGQPAKAVNASLCLLMVLLSFLSLSYH